MPYYETSQEWLRQSTLLLEARPTTTRITTKYHITKPTSRSSRKSKATTTPSDTTTTTTTAQQQQPRGTLTLKTYDPHSGVTLKYKTTKAAEVSRLILSLGRLGRRMAGLPKESEADEVMVDAPPAIVAAAPAVEGKPAQGQAQTQGGGSGGGGKGKKKKGKK
ncbi:signal recognition particle 9 kDa protein-domain-containing protein [Biscogniauxia sp. FL1348]|nr:signal recognition particle 9 kDa protein-domain-containing protein [Biscogniauxia sp. FL1348]